MFEIAPATFKFTSAPTVPSTGDYPVLVLERKSGELKESWKVWSKLGRTYAQLTNKFIVEVVGWTSLNKKVTYEQREQTSEDFDVAEEIRDYIPWSQISRRN